MPDADGYLLSPRDYGIIQELIDDFRKKSLNTRLRGSKGDWIDNQEILPPETYIALTPQGGIPGAEGPYTGTSGTSTIGEGHFFSAQCTIGFLQDNNKPIILDFTRTVYNPSPTAIPGDIWVVIERDKYGHWYAVSSGGAGGGGTPFQLHLVSPANLTDGDPSINLFSCYLILPKLNLPQVSPVSLSPTVWAWFPTYFPGSDNVPLVPGLPPPLGNGDMYVAYQNGEFPPPPGTPGTEGLPLDLEKRPLYIAIGPWVIGGYCANSFWYGNGY